jgi:hypothetical protein
LVFGGWVLSPIVGGATINQGDVSVRGLVVSLLGAIALLAIMRFVTRRTSDTSREGEKGYAARCQRFHRSRRDPHVQ